MTFRSRRVAVFVHGCFWHGHDCPRGARAPRTNASHWRGKIARNRERDADVRLRLEAAGWRVVTLWECALPDRQALAAHLTATLGPPEPRRRSARPRASAGVTGRGDPRDA